MNQQTIDRIQQDWIIGFAGQGRCLHVGCGMKPIAGAVNVDPNPDRRQWVDVGCDAHALPFADQSFSSVVSSHVIEHLLDPVAALREMGRVLEPGGMTAHVVPDHRYTPSRTSNRHLFAHHHHEWAGPDAFSFVMGQVSDLFDLVCLEKFAAFDWSFKVVAIRREV